MTRNGRYVALDAWRGICACLVMFYHFRATSHIYDLTLVRNSLFFVDFFFVLSGFIISANYFDQLRDGSGLWRFVLLRLGRLYPLHLFVLTAFVVFDLLWLSVGVDMFHGPHSPESLVTNLLLLNAMGIHDGLTWNYPSWSIGAEFYTYVTFAVLALWFPRCSGWVFAGLALACLAVLEYRAPLGIGSGNQFGFVRALYGFLLGHFVWRIHRTWAVRPPGPGTAAAGGWTALEVSVVLLGLVLVMAPLGKEARLLMPVSFGLAVLVFARERGLLSRLLQLRGFVTLGTLSYSIYMIHALVIARINDAFAVGGVLWGSGDPFVSVGGHMMIALNPYLGDLLYFLYAAIVIGLAFLTYRHIEQPGRDFCRRLSAGPMITPVMRMR